MEKLITSLGLEDVFREIKKAVLSRIPYCKESDEKIFIKTMGEKGSLVIREAAKGKRFAI